jgi:hypothetical protein
VIFLIFTIGTFVSKRIPPSAFAGVSPARDLPEMKRKAPEVKPELF